MKNSQKGYFLIFLAGVLTFLASTYILYGLMLISLSPAFMAFSHGKAAPFKAGAIFGGTFCLLLFYWMPAVIGDFSGGSVLLAWLCYIVSILISMLYFGMIGKATAILISRAPDKPLIQGLAVASIWTLGELLLSVVFRGMPWLYFFYGSNLGSNIYLIQWAEFGGEHLLSFAVFFINYLLGYYLIRKQWSRLLIPAACVGLLFAGGRELYQRNSQTGKNAPDDVHITLMCENTPPDMKWDQRNGNEVAQQLLSLHQIAVNTQPQIILWTESAIPWTYRPDDDFVQAVIQQTKSSQAINIIGINSDFQGNTVYNSAYAINNNGDVIGRYDKRFLLDFAERPLFSLHLPFIGTDGFYAEPGTDDNPISLPFGKAGAIICNESMVSSAAVDVTRNGAGFLVNISNDGWFSMAPLLINQHVYNARYRAVENRRDIVVNSNNGFTGLIRSDGSLENISIDDAAIIKQFRVHQSTDFTLYTKYPWITPIAALLFICIPFLIGKKARKKQQV